MPKKREQLLCFLLCILLALITPAVIHGQTQPVDVSSLQIPGGTGPVLDSHLSKAHGTVQVWVQLTDDPLAVAVGKNAKVHGSALNPAQQRNYLKQLAAKQDGLAATVRGLGGTELGRVSKAHNAIAVAIDASQLDTLAAQPNVLRIRPVIDYEAFLSETVPYIGASALQSLGITGQNVRVAVLDSGIDYTHFNLGGSGTAADYTAAFGTSLDDVRNRTINPALFPTSKVVGGYDFVGEHWSGATNSPPLAPDPNPIPCGILSICDGTHGTHVADIIGGKSNDGTHVGTAPGTKLYAVKVCSSVSTSCSGVALLEGMDFALDPNGDGDISDAVDVVNMSLGSNYGMREDDLSQASANAVNLGVVVVAAAGNAGDKPYIVSSPSSTPEVISVAQTQVPSAKAYPLVINSPSSIAGTYSNTATVDWAPLGAGVTGNVVYIGRACPGDALLGNPTGKIALVDRGVCAISLKTDVAGAAGAIGVLVGLIAPGDAITFSFGGGTHMVPTLVIIQSYATLIKTALNSATVNVSFGGQNFISLVGSMASTSSRGPSVSYNAIKPDIGAPGASVSAIAGTGTAQAAFGGTSGATPMIAGSAALLLQGNPNLTPAEVKALLANNAETNIFINPAVLPGVLAPITRIGGGEVRVNRAYASHTAAFDADDLTPSLSFGYYGTTDTKAFKKTVAVRNYTSKTRLYNITSSLRYADDAASGAVSISTPSTVSVPANGIATFNVKLMVNPSKLPVWTLNGGSQGGNGELLRLLEYDGYINIADGTDNVHVPWQILPHRDAAVTPTTTSVRLTNGTGTLVFSNTGTIGGRVEVFSLLGSSPKIQKFFLPQPGDNFAIIDLKSVGARLAFSGSTPLIQFAINTFGERATPNYPAEFDIYIDSNNDGTPDYLLFNAENGGFGASGQNAVFVVNLKTNVATAFFFTDADLDSANVIMTAPMSAVGLTPGTTFHFSVDAFDNYFTGNLTDSIQGMTYTAGVPRFVGSGIPGTGVPAGGSSTMTIQSVPGGDTASPSQTGLLLLYRDGKPKAEADTITVIP